MILHCGALDIGANGDRVAGAVRTSLMLYRPAR
jgi:hypothetical protein